MVDDKRLEEICFAHEAITMGCTPDDMAATNDEITLIAGELKFRRSEDNWHCTNPKCQLPIGVDHVTLVTTCHVRRFCSVECIAESQKAHYDQIMNDVIAGEMKI
jgi:hypothetical protein